MTEQLDRRADTTRLQILRAASHQFAHKSYSLVSLDDILADAEVTKGAMYFHFRSKYALASAIIEYRAAVASASVDQLLARKLSGLETLIDISYLVAVEDISDETARAGLNLLESIGRADGLHQDVHGGWVTSFARIARKAVKDGDVIADRDSELPDEPVRVLGSDRALVRVLSNLVANAIAHTPEGGKVSLALGCDENGAWARVDDTGVGIDEADLPRVFDVAYRGSNDRVPRADSSLPSGSGLGLAIAAGLVQAHRGTLSARNLTTGARFEVRLPLAE